MNLPFFVLRMSSFSVYPFIVMIRISSQSMSQLTALNFLKREYILRKDHRRY